MRIVTESELCEVLCVGRVFLWNCRKEGMPYLRMGNRNIRYDLDIVFDWFKQNTRIDKRSNYHE